jgi:hypothetical protein
MLVVLRNDERERDEAAGNKRRGALKVPSREPDLREPNGAFVVFLCPPELGNAQ